jgi:addiction module HigA family antidote
MSKVGLPGFLVTPGEILVEEFMKPMGLTQKALAESIGVSMRRINELCRGRRAVTAETALLLGRAFGTGPEFWMNLQSTHDLVLAKKNADINHIRPFKHSA